MRWPYLSKFGWSFSGNVDSGLWEADKVFNWEGRKEGNGGENDILVASPQEVDEGFSRAVCGIDNGCTVLNTDEFFRLDGRDELPENGVDVLAIKGLSS